MKDMKDNKYITLGQISERTLKKVETKMRRVIKEKPKKYTSNAFEEIREQALKELND